MTSSEAQSISLTFLSANFCGRFKNGQSSTLGSATVNSLIRDTGAHIIFGQQSSVQSDDIPTNFQYEGTSEVFIAFNADFMLSFCSPDDLQDRIQELANGNKIKLFGSSAIIPTNCVISRIKLKQYEEVGFLAVSWFASETTDSKKQRQIQLYRALNFLCSIAQAEKISMILAGSFHLNTVDVDPVIKKLKSTGVAVDCYGYLKTSIRREIRASTLYFVSGSELTVDGVRPRLLCGNLEIDTRSGLFKNLEDIFFYDPVFTSVHLRIPESKPKTSISDLQTKLQMISDCSISKRLSGRKLKLKPLSLSKPKTQNASDTSTVVKATDSSRVKQSDDRTDSTSASVRLPRLKLPGCDRLPVKHSNKTVDVKRGISNVSKQMSLTAVNSKSKNIVNTAEKTIKINNLTTGTRKVTKSHPTAAAAADKNSRTSVLTHINKKPSNVATRSSPATCTNRSAKPPTARPATEPTTTANRAKTNSAANRKQPTACFDRIRTPVDPVLPALAIVENSCLEKSGNVMCNLRKLLDATDQNSKVEPSSPDTGRNMATLESKLEPRAAKTNRNKKSFEDENDQLEILRQLMLSNSIEISKEDDLVIGDSPSDREILCEYFLNHDRVLSPIVELSESSSSIDSCCSSSFSSISITTGSTVSLCSSTTNRLDVGVPSESNIADTIIVEKIKLADIHQSSSSAYGTSISEENPDYETSHTTQGDEISSVYNNNETNRADKNLDNTNLDNKNLDNKNLDNRVVQNGDCYTESQSNPTGCYGDDGAYELVSGYVRQVVSGSLALAESITSECGAVNEGIADIDTCTPTRNCVTGERGDKSSVGLRELSHRTQTPQKKDDKYSWFQSPSFQLPTTMDLTTTHPITDPTTMDLTTTHPITDPTTMDLTTTHPITDPTTMDLTTTHPITDPTTMDLTTTHPITNPTTADPTTTDPTTTNPTTTSYSTTTDFPTTDPNTTDSDEASSDSDMDYFDVEDIATSLPVDTATSLPVDTATSLPVDTATSLPVTFDNKPIQVHSQIFKSAVQDTNSHSFISSVEVSPNTETPLNRKESLPSDSSDEEYLDCEYNEETSDVWDLSADRHKDSKPITSAECSGVQQQTSDNNVSTVEDRSPLDRGEGRVETVDSGSDEVLIDCRLEENLGCLLQ